jgi:putative GTP pyrophosphokinase
MPPREPDGLRQFLDDYERYSVDVLKPTLEELRAVFTRWTRPDYWGQTTVVSRLPSPSPIHHRWSRIKRPESVVDKILRKPADYPDGLSIRSLERMYDAVAGRIAVYFLGNLPLIDREIMNGADFEVCPDPAPLAYLGGDILRRLGLVHLNQRDKESGYASLHYIVRLRRSSLDASRRPWFELQIRTAAEHLWAELHHILGYKPEKRTTLAVTKQFQIISSQLSAIDEHFNLLYEELTRFQREATYQDADPLNAENLPAVLDGLGIGCAQNEIDGLLRMLNSRGLSTVGRLSDVGTPRTIEMIRNTFRSHEGKSPKNFEIVACLAAIVGKASDDQIIAAVHTQIEFLKAWEHLKQSMDERRDTPPHGRET